MSHVTLTRSDLFNQKQAGTILGMDRRTVKELTVALGLVYKSDPTRVGKMLDRADIDRLAAMLGRTIDWEAIAA